MKIKCLPDDFIVEEVVDLPQANGPFAVYRLSKHSLGTLEAIDAVAHRWNLPRQRVNYAGLKDKHAATMQFLTIHNGPRQGMQHEHFELEYLGPTIRPLSPRDIVANRFTIVLRDMTEDELARATEAGAEIGRSGLPNYFDDQRFGSLGESGEFIAKPWCEVNYERAIWLALADDNVHDRPDEKEQKRLLREHWGDWLKLKATLERSHRRSIITYLCDKPTDFRGAIARIRQDLRGLYLAAYQSDLWNRLLDRLLRQVCGEDVVSLKIGKRDVAFFKSLTPEQRTALDRRRLPLPCARTHSLDPDTEALVNSVLAEEGLTLKQLRVKYPRDSFFSKGERPAIMRPTDWRHEAGEDEIYYRKRKLCVEFTLPRGSYATILVKRLTTVAGQDLSAGLGGEEEETAEGEKSE